MISNPDSHIQWPVHDYTLGGTPRVPEELTATGLRDEIIWLLYVSLDRLLVNFIVSSKALEDTFSVTTSYDEPTHPLWTLQLSWLARRVAGGAIF